MSSLDKKSLSERDVCTKFTTPAIYQAGWTLQQFREEVKITDGRVMVRGNLASRVKNPWLAFDYRNFRACGNVGNRKKGGWFPLQAGSLVSTYENQCEESEIPYLLDPTDADDVELIAFDEEGKAIPAPGNTPWEMRRVEETINRLKLNEHEALTQQRQKVWQRMSLEIEKYQRFKARCATGSNPAARTLASEHARNIRAMTRETQELSAVAKWCVLFRNDNQLSRLVA